MRKIGVISLMLVLVQINFANAKVWLLPDYQREQFFSHRVNGDDNADNSEVKEEFSCSDYKGLKPLSAIDDNMTCTDYFYGPKKCCQNWICKTSLFPETENSCHSEGKIPTGATCTNKDGTVNYQKCKCDTNLYPYILSNCEHILSGTSPCSDEDGLHYQECITACEKAEREGVTCISNCDYGCEESYPDCEDCCVECKTCPQRDCTTEGYVATKQSNVLYHETDICYLSCEDSTPYYKPIGCAANYYNPNVSGCDVNYYNPDNYWGDVYCK